ncbi:MAG: glycosyltransferase [Candidatus Paraimprobicoccus trichonymphae]|uniref:Glycosyltransferase n=1 Tax=Candidatus Paraimprobicoccus trichonymphae TaxID=3033793 RepID=A0AA48HZ66_9FIRM|nr:MAG: glycosyltransferase [Candidatus Paraimprobicoccus trichonymphae]
MVYNNFKVKFITVLSSISIIVYIVWRYLNTIPVGHGWLSTTCAIILLTIETIGIFETFVYYYGANNPIYPELPKIDEEFFPEIDIFVTTYNESANLLKNTILGCLNLEYPDKNKVHIYLCDDGNRKEIKALAKDLKVKYLAREERLFAKAGNLNNALKKTKSPLIANFDADMIPDSKFLMKTVPYFLKSEEKIGFIQTPQGFYEPDLFQYYLCLENKIPNEQDYFYKNVQITKNKSNSVIYGGTNAVLSREALKKINGFSTVSITEDFATGILIQSRGYTCYAINEVLSSGVPPHNLKSLVKQRQRWARGCIQTGRRLNILSREDLSIQQKLNYISSVSYWFFCLKRLIYIIFPILFSVFNIVVAKCDIKQALIFWGPMYVLTNLALRILSNKIRTSKWTSIYETVLAPFLFFPVILESMGFSKKEFIVTKKDNKNGKSSKIWFIFFYSLYAIFTIIGLIKSFYWVYLYKEKNQLLTLFWLSINLFYLFAAIFFALGRKREFYSSSKGSNEFSGVSEAPEKLNKTRSKSQRTKLTFKKSFILLIFLSVSVIAFNKFCINNLEKLIFPKMNCGINIGNALESPKDVDWGMDLKNRYLKEIQEAGFDHVRIPVRFSDYTDKEDNYRIDRALLSRLDKHILYALELGLTVILDLHHFNEIMDEPQKYEEEFYNIWEQLSVHYKNYPKELIFELLNEPVRNLYPELWNTYIKNSIQIIREDNPYRLVIFGPYYYYNIDNIERLELPYEDPYIMVAFHYYEPNDFAFQGNKYHPGFEDLKDIPWKGSSADLDFLSNRFERVENFAKEHKVKVTLNEFGVTKEAPRHFRRLWTEEVRKEAERRNFSVCYWEFGSGFGIYNIERDVWDHDMLEALIPLPNKSETLKKVQMSKSRFK